MLYLFVPNELMYYLVANLMKEHDEFRDAIERNEKDFKIPRQDAKDVFNIMRNYGDKN